MLPTVYDTVEFLGIFTALRKLRKRQPLFADSLRAAASHSFPIYAGDADNAALRTISVMAAANHHSACTPAKPSTNPGNVNWSM